MATFANSSVIQTGAKYIVLQPLIDVGPDPILVVLDPRQVILFDVGSGIHHVPLEQTVGPEKGIEFVQARECVELVQHESRPLAVPVGLRSWRSMFHPRSPCGKRRT